MGPVLSSDRCILRLSKNFHLNSNDHGSLSRTNIFFSFKKSDCLEGPKLCAGFFKNLESRPILWSLQIYSLTSQNDHLVSVRKGKARSLNLFSLPDGKDTDSWEWTDNCTSVPSKSCIAQVFVNVIVHFA